MNAVLPETMSAGVHSKHLRCPGDSPDAAVGGCQPQLTAPGAQGTSICLVSKAHPTGWREIQSQPLLAPHTNAKLVPGPESPHHATKPHGCPTSRAVTPSLGKLQSLYNKELTSLRFSTSFISCSQRRQGGLHSTQQATPAQE